MSDHLSSEEKLLQTASSDQTGKSLRRSVKKEGSFEHGSRPEKKGRYHNDYAPRFRERYDIYEKAKAHMRSLKKSVDEGVRGDSPL